MVSTSADFGRPNHLLEESCRVLWRAFCQQHNIISRGCRTVANINGRTMRDGKLRHRRNVVVILRNLLAVDVKTDVRKSGPTVVNECCRPIPCRRLRPVRPTVVCVSPLRVGNCYVWFRQDCRVLNTCQEGPRNNSAHYNSNNNYGYNNSDYGTGTQSSILG